MHQYIVLLSDLSYAQGLIGIVEYRERRAVARWLSDAEEGLPDPRHRRGETREFLHESHGEESVDASEGTSAQTSAADRRPQFLALNKWMFTLGDADCYPSVPHGHLHRKTNKWPKLDPYTGRAFSDVHVEDPARLLAKAEMKLLWSNAEFVEHCRQQVLWYSSFAPSYQFPRARFGKLKFPKW